MDGFLDSFLTYVNIISAVLVVVCVLIQNRGASLSNVFGGDSEAFYTRRGFDKIIYTVTIVLAIVFVGSVLARLMLLS
ncbi:MAG: preprotein translocase subunit SecG [Candidatus Moranbacteria bacterium]|nr:preprotein translocase subunit SecG [Candidatus Moranbacteria bacterium]